MIKKKKKQAKQENKKKPKPKTKPKQPQTTSRQKKLKEKRTEGAESPEVEPTKADCQVTELLRPEWHDLLFAVLKLARHFVGVRGHSSLLLEELVGWLA